MILKVILLAVFGGLASVYSDGKFTVLTHPRHVNFVETNSKLDTSEVPGIIFSLFGLPTSYNLKWDGLLEGNLFKKPKAIALFSLFVQANDEASLSSGKRMYTTTENIGDIDGQYINSHIEGLNWESGPFLVETSFDNQLLDIKSTFLNESSSLSLDSLIGELKTTNWLTSHNVGSLNTSSDLDLTLLGELYAVSKVVRKLQVNNALAKYESPDFYHFKITGMKAIVKKEVLDDAWTLVNEVITEAVEQMKQIYDDNVVAIAVTMTSNPGSVVDFGRQLKALNDSTIKTQTGNNSTNSINKAPKFDGLFPVIFNIVLWFGIAFSITMIWISWSIWHMDPGRDSVIYRMTTQRLKRD